MFGEDASSSEKHQLQERIRRIRDELTTREARKRKSEDRSSQLQREAQHKNAELAELTGKLEAARLRLAALKGEEVRLREKEYVPFDRAAARVDPREALLATKKRLDELQVLLDRSTAQKDLPTYVDVHFNAYKCSFALSNRTTFDSLKEEASFHWGITSPTILKNANDEEYVGSAIVQTTLAEERKQLGIAPYVRLHVNIKNQQAPGTPLLSPASVASPRKTVRVKEVRDESLRIPFGEDTGMSNDVSEPSGFKNNELQMRDYIRQKEREAWQAAVMRQSLFFHDEEFATRVDPTREPLLPKARRRYIKMTLARSCFWIVFWAATVGLTIASMIFRFDIATTFSLVQEVNDILGAQSFCLPLHQSSPADNVFSATLTMTSSPQNLYISSCGKNQLVRRFGGFSANSQEDVLSPIIPSQRMLDMAEIEYWGKQVLLPALNLSVTDKQSQQLVSGQSLLLGNVFQATYAAANQQFCSGFFYKYPIACPCFKDYSPSSISSICPAPFVFSQNTPLDDLTGKLRSLYLADGCTMQSGGEWPSGDWLATNIRVLLFDFNLVNVNLGWVARVKASVEMGPDKLLVSSISTDVLPLSVYEAYAPRFKPLVIVADALLVFYALVSVFYWIIRPKLLGYTTSLLRPLLTVWNLIIVLLLLVSLTQIGLGIGYELSIVKSIDLNAVNRVQDLAWQTTSFYAYLGLSCVSLFLLILSVFKHLQGDPKLSLLFQTVHRSARTLGALGFFFVLAIASMSVWANLAWGSYIFAWTSIERCIALLGGMVFGAPIDFATIRETQNTQMWTAFFFIIFVFFVILILVQFYAAIVLDAFLEIEAVSKERERNGSPENVYWFNLLFSPATWLEEPRNARKKPKKVPKSFGAWFKVKWERLKRILGFSKKE